MARCPNEVRMIEVQVIVHFHFLLPFTLDATVKEHYGSSHQGGTSLLSGRELLLWPLSLDQPFFGKCILEVETLGCDWELHSDVTSGVQALDQIHGSLNAGGLNPHPKAGNSATHFHRNPNHLRPHLFYSLYPLGGNPPGRLLDSLTRYRLSYAR
jgi:hypothetical protein